MIVSPIRYDVYKRVGTFGPRNLTGKDILAAYRAEIDPDGTLEMTDLAAFHDGFVQFSRTQYELAANIEIVKV